MTYDEAIEKARLESEAGYVQHVNRAEYQQGESEIVYTVSDWYDCDATVISFENGKEK